MLIRLLGLLVLFVAGFSFAGESRFDCKYQDYYLVLSVNPLGQAKHTLKINNKIELIELSKGDWFIEQVVCTKTGFDIIASHAQHQDYTTKLFKLTYSGQQRYKLN